MKTTPAHQCIRCDKSVYGVHTCRPSDKYKAGIVEGLKMAYDEVDSVYDPCDATEKFKRSALETLEISIKQYSGDE